MLLTIESGARKETVTRQSSHSCHHAARRVQGMAAYDFDLVCLGSGPAGQRAAVQAAKLGKRAAIVEKQRVVGGVCVETGTIPSKTFREAVLSFAAAGSLLESGVLRPEVRPTASSSWPGCTT